MGQKLMSVHGGDGGRRRQDLHPDPEGALRPGAGITGQAELARAVHHAQAHRRDAAGNVQISETIGSGPFVFNKDLWRPGEKVVYDKFQDYKPRSEPPSGLAGGKVVHVDRVEWVTCTDSADRRSTR